MKTQTKPIILFDMDGTLLDLAFDDFIWNQQLPEAYAMLHQCSIQHSLKKFNEFHQQSRQTLAWYSSKAWTALTGVDVMQLHYQHANRVKIRQNSLKLLQTLNDLGYDCWVVTNADQTNLAFKCHILPEFPHYFQHMISSEQIGYAKEHPEFWKTLQQLHPFDPTHVVLIDDNFSVLHAAKQFGINHLLTILQPSSEQKARCPDQLNYPYLDDLMELMPYLDQLQQ